MLKQEYPDKQTLVFTIICIKINNQKIFLQKLNAPLGWNGREGKTKEGKTSNQRQKVRQKRERVVERCQEDICEMYHQVTRGIVVGNLEVDYCVFSSFLLSVKD